MKTLYKLQKQNRPITLRQRFNLMLRFKSLFANLIIFSLFSSQLAIISVYVSHVQAQETRAVTVTADQPNIWTLEQAHYLLAQMHRRNLDLKAKGLSELDANEINGINIDILRSILDISATYDDAARVSNGLIRKDKEFNAERRRQLVSDIDKLEKEKLELTKTIAVLKREYETAENDDEKAKIQAKINEQLEIKAEVESQIESKRQELSSLSAATGTLTNTASGGQGADFKIPAGSLDNEIKAKIVKALEGFEANPKLNASLQLDKFLQLQYEIISKQLTLLRDEVGPGEQLLFLELPQSINAAYNKSNGMWAQSRWRIGGFSRCELNINNEKVPCYKLLYQNRNQNRQSRTTLDIFESITENNNAFIRNNFDNLILTISDIQNQKDLAKRFVDRENIGDEKRKGDPIFKHLVDKYGAKTLNIAESSAVDNHIKFLSDFDFKRDTVKDDQKNMARSCGVIKNEACSLAQTKLQESEKELKEAEEKISRPSRVLLNLILSILNSAINSEKQLSKDSDLTLPYNSSRAELISRIEAKTDKTRKLFNRLWIEDLFFEELYKLQETDVDSGFIDLNPPDDSKDSIKINGKKIDNRSVRTIEIIPRQSSLNVNDIKVRNKSGVFNFVASTLFGLGGSFNYRQQRERYSQFVQQELYSSGFGKGSREFGWTFTAMPGSDRLLSGTRNTYAVVVVPKEATSIMIESVGCSFKNSAAQPNNFDDAVSKWLNLHDKNNCAENKNFVIPIPGGGYGSNNDFYVSGLTYEPVEKGKRIMVSIYGSNFSSQIGVMVDGVPLPASIGIAQNFIRDDSAVAKEYLKSLVSQKVTGTFERVDSNQIIASFEIPDRETGTPIITLISPGKAADLNSLTNLYINKNQNTSLKEAEWMFGSKPSGSFKVGDTQLFISKEFGEEIGELTVLITGSGLDNITNAFVNGLDLTCPGFNCGYSRRYLTSNIYELKFQPPREEKIQIILESGNHVLKLKAMDNPAKKEKQKEPPSLKPDDLSFTVKQIIPIYLDEKKFKIAQILVEIQGKGFNSSLESSSGELNVINDSKAFITIPDPKPAQTVKLTDHKKNIYATGVIELSEIIKPVPVKTPTPTSTATPNP